MNYSNNYILNDTPQVGFLSMSIHLNMIQSIFAHLCV